MNWLLNELLIVFLRIRLMLQLHNAATVTPGIARDCRLLLRARDRRPAWLADWFASRRKG